MNDHEGNLQSGDKVSRAICYGTSMKFHEISKRHFSHYLPFNYSRLHSAPTQINPPKKSEANRWQLLRCRAEIITTSDLNSKKLQPKQTDVAILSWKEMMGASPLGRLDPLRWANLGPPHHLPKFRPNLQRSSSEALWPQTSNMLWQKCITNFGGYNSFEQS